MSIAATATATVAAATVTVTAAAPFPIFFETGWGVLSMVNLLLAAIGIMVIGIVGLNRLSFLPAFISSVSCLANGLCYFAWYTTYSVHSQRAAAGVANVCWGMQEIVTPFYSYFILKKILVGKQRMFFLTAFWFFTFVLICVRTTIAVLGTIALGDRQSKLGPTITHLHNGYFSVLASTEIMSAFFLLKKFYKAGRRNKSIGMERKASLFQHLARSTEVRLATLACIGIMRACTYSFANVKSTGKNQTTQLDRMAAVMLNIFPVVMMVDLLSARMSHVDSQNYTSDYPDSYKKNDKWGWDAGEYAKRQSKIPGMETIARDFGEYVGSAALGFGNNMDVNGPTENGPAVTCTKNVDDDPMRKASVQTLYETQGGGRTMKISPVAYTLGTLPDIKEFPYPSRMAKAKSTSPPSEN